MQEKVKAEGDILLAVLLTAKCSSFSRYFTYLSGFSTGLGDPAYFYVTFVFLLNGAMMSLFFIYGTYLR